MKLTQVYFLIFILTVVTISESLRCVRQCNFITFPINGTISVNSCTYIERNNSQCSLFVEINHQRRTATGYLSIEDCTNVPTYRIETQVRSNFALYSTLRYTCMEDSCTSEFLETIFPLNLNVVNTAIIEQELTELIYNPSSNLSNVSCTSTSTCSDKQICQANYMIKNTSDIPPASLAGSSSCIKYSEKNYLLNIKQNCLSIEPQPTEMLIRCNLANCVNATTASDVYNLISEHFPLSHNCSYTEAQTCMPKTSTGASFLTLSYGLIILITVVLLPY
jgi:hypothetical protein